MKILAVYHSNHGNGAKIAQAISNELSKRHNVTLQTASQAKVNNANSYEMVIIGSPTCAFSPDKSIKAYAFALLKSINTKFAIYDTNIHPRKLGGGISFLLKIFGYSNDTLLKILKKKNVKVISVEKFYVDGVEGPLAQGEPDRARKFAIGLG